MVPMLTWGLVRSKAVARPRTASLSLVKTWWTGLTARGRIRDARLERARRLMEREMLDIFAKWKAKDNQRRSADEIKKHDGRTSGENQHPIFPVCPEKL